MERRNAWKTYTQEQLKELDQINDRYKVCLDEGKTERECIRLTVKEIEKQGYRNLNDIKGSLKTGDKVYAVCMGKSIVMFRIGKEPLENGMNILGAHIDSPRIDVKQNPLYENEELAYLDTHYYRSSDSAGRKTDGKESKCSDRRRETGSSDRKPSA